MINRFIEKYRGKFLPICARPGMGTTALALQTADVYAQSEDKIVVFFSIRMAKEEIIGRMACQRLSIDYYCDIKRHLLSEEEQNRFEQEKDNIAKGKLQVLEISDLTGEDVKQLLYSTGNVGLVVVDDLDGFENKITVAALKEMAERMNVPVLTTCHVGRAAERRIGKLPQRKDIKIKELSEAETVYFLHRPSYYDINANGTDAVLVADTNTRTTVPLRWMRQGMVFASL